MQMETAQDRDFSGRYDTEFLAESDDGSLCFGMDQTVTLSSNGEVPIPKEFRERDGIVDSDHFRFQRIARGQ